MESKFCTQETNQTQYEKEDDDMFGGGKDDLFGFVPDLDGDGDSDIVDYLILEDILNEEQRASERKRAEYDDDDEEDEDEEDED